MTPSITGAAKRKRARLREALEARLAACKLELHPQKTKIVYCKDANRRGSYPEQAFDFLGYTFRPRRVRNRAGRLFISFAPAVSDRAAKAMRQRVRRWQLHHRTDLALDAIAQWARPVVQGWVRYYARFYPSALRGRLAHAGSLPGALGATQIQATPGPQQAGLGLAQAGESPPAYPISALGPGIDGWTIGAV